jgi:hypothetical protein
VRVQNTEIAGRRYPAFLDGDALLNDEIFEARKRLASWCGCKRKGGVKKLLGCALEAKGMSGGRDEL